MTEEELKNWRNLQNSDNNFVKNLYELSTDSTPIKFDNELDKDDPDIETIE